MSRLRSPLPWLKFHGQWQTGKKLQRLPLHRNPGLEVVLISRGELRWQVEGIQSVLGPNTLFYTLPWQVHGGVEEVQPSSEIFYFCIALARNISCPVRRFRFHPALGFTASEASFVSDALTGAQVQSASAGEHSQSFLRYFFHVADSRAPLWESLARESIKLLLLELASRIKGRAPSIFVPEEAERRVRGFIRSLSHRFAEPWTLETMGKACGLGRTQFAQLFKKLAGDTPFTYLNRRRIIAAQELIEDSGKTITEIALDVGFNSSQYFATVFKQFNGSAARDFRRGHCKATSTTVYTE